MNRRFIAPAALAAYLATIPAANWAIVHVSTVPHDPGMPGAVPVWVGLYAPAGVYVAGLALVLRDLAREAAGRAWVLAAMAVGVGLSYLLAAPAVATASAVAFAVSESLDYGVYEPLRRRNLTAAVGCAAAVGLVADSLLFLSLAFHSLAFLPGQLVGKTWMTLAAVAIVWARRRVWQVAL